MEYTASLTLDDYILPCTRRPDALDLTRLEHSPPQTSDIAVCLVDKGGGVVVLDANLHRHAINSHLHDANTYQRVSAPAEDVLLQWQQRCIATMTEHLGMDSGTAEAILRDTSIPSFYVIIKLHKLTAASGMTVSPSRPIAAAFNSPAPSRYASDVCVRLLQPLVQNDGWTLQSTPHLLRWIETNETPIPPSAYLLTMDVTALYPSMPGPVEDTVAPCISRFCTVNQVDPNARAVVALRALLHCVLDNSY